MPKCSELRKQLEKFMRLLEQKCMGEVSCLNGKEITPGMPPSILIHSLNGPVRSYINSINSVTRSSHTQLEFATSDPQGNYQFRILAPLGPGTPDLEAYRNKLCEFLDAGIEYMGRV